MLNTEIESLTESLASEHASTGNPFTTLIMRIRRWRRNRRLNTLTHQFDQELDKPHDGLLKDIASKQKACTYLTANLDLLVEQRLARVIQYKERIDRALGLVQTWLHGARGEREVLRVARIKRKKAESQRRYFVEMEVCLGAVHKRVQVNLVDRSGFKFHMLVGRNFLRDSFIVDPSLQYTREPS